MFKKSSYSSKKYLLSISMASVFYRLIHRTGYSLSSEELVCRSSCISTDDNEISNLILSMPGKIVNKKKTKEGLCEPDWCQVEEKISLVGTKKNKKFRDWARKNLQRCLDLMISTLCFSSCSQKSYNSETALFIFRVEENIVDFGTLSLSVVLQNAVQWKTC